MIPGVSSHPHALWRRDLTRMDCQCLQRMEVHFVSHTRGTRTEEGPPLFYLPPYNHIWRAKQSRKRTILSALFYSLLILSAPTTFSLAPAPAVVLLLCYPIIFNSLMAPFPHLTFPEYLCNQTGRNILGPGCWCLQSATCLCFSELFSRATSVPGVLDEEKSRLYQNTG